MCQNGLESALGITKCVRYYKVWQQWITKCVRYYKVCQNGLKSALGITKCGRVDYKVHQGLKSVAELQSELVHTSVPITSSAL